MNIKNFFKERETAVLAAVLALCVAVLGALVFLFFSTREPEMTTDPTTTESQYVSVPELEGRTLFEAREILESVGVEYEIVPTESRRANVVESVELDGERVDEGAFKVSRGATVTLRANEIGIDRVVYLTFDDGPTSDNTFDILDILDGRGIGASFFVVGNRIEQYKDRIQAIVDRGHVLACHSFTHELQKIYGEGGIDALLDEIGEYEGAVEEALGEGAMDSVGRFFRFPGGSTQNGYLSRSEATEYIAAVRDAGYRIYDWTALTGDRDTPANNKAEDMIEELDATLARAKNRGEALIVLMHDMRYTLEALPEILDYLFSEGYYFDTIDHCDEYVF